MPSKLRHSRRTTVREAQNLNLGNHIVAALGTQTGVACNDDVQISCPGQNSKGSPEGFRGCLQREPV